MTMLEIHRDALENSNAVYHEFLLRYKAHANVVYGIVEGKEDPMFYRGLIERVLPENWRVELIPAGQKNNVLKSISAFDWTRFSPKRICFFVDRDLSEFIPGLSVVADNIYVTDNYSIENNVVGFDVLRRCLEEVLNVSDLKPTEAELIELRFLSALSLFQEAMVAIMAQIILWRRNGERPSLNNIHPDEFFVFANGGINLKSQFETAQARVGHAAKRVSLEPSGQVELSNAEAEFRQKQGVERFIRGKYLLWFLVEFALEIHRSLPLFLSRFTVPPKVRVSIGLGNAIVVLAPRVRCPSSLQGFLECTYVQYIQEKARLHSTTSAMLVGTTA